jgi:pimeloyl-ACP methyl ester carboxylesterase
MNETASVCEYAIEGNDRGPTLVFIHGWPDNASLWRKQVDALGGRFRCVLVTLPNFGARPERSGGFDFPELVSRLAATVQAVQPEGTVGLVTHDWGAYLGYLLEQRHPERFSRMAALDIGGHLKPTDLKSILMITGYQWALIAGWLAGGLIPPLGDAFSRGVASVIRVPRRQRRELRSRYNYPYFYLWRGLLWPPKSGGLLRRYRPGCPVLYLYGERKPVMFHSARWLRRVAESGGHAEGLPGAGHWLMETHPEAVNEKLADWFGGRARG